MEIWSKQKSRQTAVLLAFFLGMFGMHRFYLGRKTSGTILLVATIFFWFIYPSTNALLLITLWVLFDLFLILTKRLTLLPKKDEAVN